MPITPAPVLGSITTRLGQAVPLFARWLQQLAEALNLCAYRDGSVSLTAQNAAIAATAVPILTVYAGTYRVNYYTRVTTAAGVSSELIVTMGWTDGAVAQTHVGATVNGNTTASHDEASFLIRVDEDTTITYSTSYASNAAGAMRYRLDIVVERVPT